VGPDINLPGTLYVGGTANTGALTVRGAIGTSGLDVGGDAYVNYLNSRGDVTVSRKLNVTGEAYTDYINSRGDGTITRNLVVGGIAFLGWSRVQSQVTLAAGQVGEVVAYCTNGTGIMSGGYDASHDDVRVTKSRAPDSGGGWLVRAVNESASSSVTITAYAICARIGS
jgi:hypothetical protein